MNCKAKITALFGTKYECLMEATTKVTIVTFAPHLQRNVTTVRYLCDKHTSRLISRYKYKIKHLNKQTSITKEKL